MAAKLDGRLRHTFIRLLKACGRMSNLKEGKRIHADALKYGCNSDIIVSSCLVDMYGKCGSIVDARAVFDGVSQRDGTSWNVMLNVYVQHGQPENALGLYEKMREEGASPNQRTFLSALQGCGILAEQEKVAVVLGRPTKVVSLVKGKTIHAEAWRKGCDVDVFVGNTLVSMYGKCGSIVDAQSVFDGLTHRDVVSWNAMLSVYTQLGQADIVVHLYEQMCQHGTNANDRTLVSALQACGMLAEMEDSVVINGQSTKAKALETGKAIHADARRQGYDCDVYVGSTLSSMYGKCGSLVDAQNSFDGLLRPDVVAWNAVIGAYVDQGLADKGWHMYERMREELMSPNSRTFVSVLQACCMLDEKGEDLVGGQFTKMKSLQRGKVIHADLQRRGYDMDVFLGSALVSMYGKCGSIIDAQGVFDGLSQRDVVSWNAMLAAYAQQDEADEALHLYVEMQEEGVNPDLRTFVSALHACGMIGEKEEDDGVDGQSAKLKSLAIGKAIHADAQKKGYGSDIFVACTLVSMYSKCRSIVDAENVFYSLSYRDVVSWTAMIAAYVEGGQPEKALELYEQMQQQGVQSDMQTFVNVLHACSMLAEKDVVEGRSSRAECLEGGKAIHAHVQRKGLDLDLFFVNTLINMYGKCGSIVDAQKLFDGLSQRDVVSWNVMLAAYVQQGQSDKALELYKQMQGEQVVRPNEITLACILQACGNTGSLTICREIHDNLITTGQNFIPLLTNTLIHAYGRCSSMEDAQAIFDGLPHPDVVSWNALVAGYARQGDCTASLQCYKEMQLSDVNPNGVTFLSVLSACSHAGLVDKGVEYFESMSRDYGITPGIEHYVSMVDLLGRAGHFRRVEQLMSTMPMQPNLSMWSCLMGACRKHGKVMLGKWAFDQAVRLQPKYASTYVLMSNIYADAGLWDCAKELQELREKEGAWKKPGESWIEHEQDVHAFVVGDGKNPQPGDLYEMLEQIKLDLKEADRLHGSRSVSFC